MIYAILYYWLWVGGLCIGGMIIDRIIRAYERRRDHTIKVYNRRRDNDR